MQDAALLAPAFTSVLRGGAPECQPQQCQLTCTKAVKEGLLCCSPSFCMSPTHSSSCSSFTAHSDRCRCCSCRLRVLVKEPLGGCLALPCRDAGTLELCAGSNCAFPPREGEYVPAGLDVPVFWASEDHRHCAHGHKDQLPEYQAPLGQGSM